MTSFTNEQLEAWAGLGPLTIHHGANSHCFKGRILVSHDDHRCIAFVEGDEVSDADGFAVGIEPTERAKALAAAPDLARLVLERDAEIARKDAALNQIDALEVDWKLGADENLERAKTIARQAMKETSDE